jgi:Flp pilus assembly protein TadD
MRTFILSFLLVAALSGIALSQVDQTAFVEAAREANAGRFEAAREKYSALLKGEKDKSKLAQIHLNIGVCLYHLGKFESAVAEYETAIQSRRDYQKAFYSLGMAHSALGNTEKAKSAFYAALKLNKNDGEAWFDLGMVLLKDRDRGPAFFAFTKAIEHKSFSASDAHNNLGVILALNGDWIRAEREFELANTSNEAKNNLAICRKYKNDNNHELIAALNFSNKISGE